MRPSNRSAKWVNAAFQPARSIVPFWVALGGTGQRYEAVPFCQTALDRIKSKLGNDDPMILQAIQNLASAYINGW